MFQLHTRFIIDLSAIIITLDYSEFGGTDGKESSCQCRRHKTCSFNPQSPWGWKEPQEEEMATQSRKIPWTEEPGGLQSMGLQGVGRI